MKLRTNQRGDTIIEVLMCIMVVGVALVGAFNVTNRSQTGVRDSQEHAQALKLVESQLEQIRASAKNHAGAIFATSTPTSFCMVNVAPVASTNAACHVDSSGNPTTATPMYNLSVSCLGGSCSSAGGHTFQVVAAWDSVNGAATKAQETMVYRIYP